MNKISTNVRKGAFGGTVVTIAQIVSILICKRITGIPDDLLTEFQVAIAAILTAGSYAFVNFIKHYQKKRY